MAIIKDQPETDTQKKEKVLNAHDLLVRRGEKWLNSQGCKVVIRDEMRAFTTEIPDVIGWRDGLSILIECKTSRADFLSDAKKSFRQHPEQGMGDWRFFMCPPGIIQPIDLPEGWGLLWVYPNIVKKMHGFPPNTQWHRSKPFKAARRPEMRMLVSALRRLSLRGHLEDIYAGIPEPVETFDMDIIDEPETTLFENGKAG